jgi:hypothetical protein
MRRASKAIYYAINDDPRYLFFAKKSVESLRRHNRELPAYLFLYGAAPKRDLSFFSRHRVEVIEKRPVRRERATFLKWLPLRELFEERLLFADADTVFFQDPEKLFTKLREHDFYAREETGTSEALRHPYLIGSRVYSQQIHHELYGQLARGLGGKKLPIFNSGVMVFNHAIHREIAKGHSCFEELRKAFAKGKLPYPCTNPHLADEVVASLVLGCISGLRYGLIEGRLSPWYVEWKGRAVRSTGVLMHIFTIYYPFFLEDFYGARAKATYLSLVDRLQEGQ